MTSLSSGSETSKASSVPSSVLREVAQIAKELERRKRTERLRDYSPYQKQIDFHNAGTRERLLMAGNQLGKTLAHSAEVAMHLTGEYPDWWTGHKFKKPIVALVGSESYELTRDGFQRLLVGPPAIEEDWGTGFIPARCIKERTRRSGVSNALDSVTVSHSSGGSSVVLFKAYEQGRAKWQANTVDYVGFDEEPPEDVYMEGITRTNATRGLIGMTFTPLKGMSSVVARYLLEPSDDRSVTTMTIEDADHISPEERARIIASYPPHEVEARTKGIPTLGSGRIYPVAEESIRVDAFPIPRHWALIGGLDFGWDHPTSGVALAWDADTDTVYVVAAYRRSKATPLEHAATLKKWGGFPWAWPHDGLHQQKDGGKNFRDQYREHGLEMLHVHAQHPDGGYGVEAGIIDILTRMQTGRFKVFSHLNDWWEEFRLYHRVDGKIVKERDDIMDATRTGMMMLRFAERPEIYDADVQASDEAHGRNEVTGY